MILHCDDLCFLILLFFLRNCCTHQQELVERAQFQSCLKIAGWIEEKDLVSAVVREMPQRRLTLLVTREFTPLDGRKSFRVRVLLDLKQRNIY